jgi:hypothetical protein
MATSPVSPISLDLPGAVNITDNISEESKKKLKMYANTFILPQGFLGNQRARYEKIDRLIVRSVNPFHKDSCVDERIDSSLTADGKKIPDGENVSIPVVAPQLTTLISELAKIFLAEDPPLQMVTVPGLDEIANKYNLLYSKYAREFQWRRNLLLCFQDAVRYNVCAAEVGWINKKGRKPSAEIDSKTGFAKAQATITSGEQIKHLDIYNTYWDSSVIPSEVCTNGAYIGYVKAYTSINLAKFLSEESIILAKEEISNIFKRAGEISTTTNLIRYYEPDINNVGSPKEVMTHDALFDGTDKVIKTSTVQHEVNIIYVRILPVEFDIVDGLDSLTPQIYKLIIINNAHLVKVEQQTNIHDCFPIILGQLREDALKLNALTFSEEMEPIQNTATKLYQADLASSRRLIADRLVYNPRKINQSDIESTSPVTRIKTKNHTGTLSDVIQQLPYSDPTLGLRISQANQLLPVAGQITGANQAMNGQFVKGNKTESEYQNVVGNAVSKIQLNAVFLDDQFFSPLRKILKSDTLQYQSNITVYDKNSGQQVAIDPTELRNNELEFDIAAGLLPAEQLLSTEFFQVLLQSVASNPQLAMEFKTMEAICYMASIKGVRYFKRFIKTDEEKLKEQEQRIAEQKAIAQAQQPQQPAQSQ